MGEGIKVLIIEDDPGDVCLIREMMSDPAQGIVFEHADRLSAGFSIVEADGIDMVLLDLGLPDSQGLGTIKGLCEKFPDLPVVVLTGLSDEHIGIQSVQEGAQDYLVKGQINSGMLAKAIRYAIERKRIENEKERLIHELQEALAKVKLLSGFLPICASCKKIRDDKGYWNQIEAYISKHSEAEFSHGICPDCAKKLYPELYEKNN
jgi:DNA-binding response OmpR family regulator